MDRVTEIALAYPALSGFILALVVLAGVIRGLSWWDDVSAPLDAPADIDTPETRARGAGL
jgi:hypothetical protein